MSIYRIEITPEVLNSRTQGLLSGRFGIRVVEVAQGRLKASMQVEPWMAASGGFLHAAAVVALADSGAGYACFAHLPASAKGFTTIELKTNFMGSARDGVLTCETSAEHLGRATQIWDSRILDARGKAIALFRCTQMILSG